LSTPGAWLIVLSTIVFLIATNSFFVLAEFGTISVRRSRLALLAQQGDPMAARLLPIVENPRRLDRYIAACQVGITTSSLILGYFGQGQAARLAIEHMPGTLRPEVTTTIATAGVLFVLTALQIVLGELVPKNVSLRYAERIALTTAVPMRFATALFEPLIRVLNGSGQLFLRAVGYHLAHEGAHVHRPDEIMLLVAESGAGGALDAQEQRLLENALRVRDMTVRQAMVARTRLLAAPIDESRDRMLRLLADSPDTRLLLYDGSLDNIRGTVHLTDLLCTSDADWDSRQAVRPLPFVPAGAPLGEAIARLQLNRQPVAIVLDEFGGTAGMIAVDDLVEAIFGELQDEFDTESLPMQAAGDGRIHVLGEAHIDEVNDRLNLFLPSQEADTIGGLVIDVLGHVPMQGDEVTAGDVALRVDRMHGNAVASVSFAATPQQLAALREPPA